MEQQRIEQNVVELLNLSGIKNEGLVVQQTLHHMLMCVKLYETLDAGQRERVAKWRKHFQFLTDVKFNLKERKGRKEKKTSPSYSPNKEKAEKGKGEKTLSLVRDAKEAFRLECKALSEQYDRQEVTKFYEWYTQKDDDGVMLFELERKRKGWNTKTRLKKWLNNQFAASNKAAAIRLKKAQGAAQADTAQQRAIAAERERANAEAERQREADKAGAVSYEEWQASKKTTD